MNVQSSKDILSALVSFDTVSRNSNLDLIAWVEGYLDRLGVKHERIYDETGQKSNLWATLGPADVPGYILSGHTDVVPVDDQDWTDSPFKLTERDGKLYGRGSCDMKGYVACCLAAVPDMLKANLKKPLHLSLSYDEEVGCWGVRGVIAKLPERPARPIACFVGEPTDMDVVIGHKAKRSFKVVVHGRTCHSSLAPLGVNAVEYAARVIAKIRDISDRLAKSGARDDLYDIPFTTGHTGYLHGGTALNIVPDLATFEFEFRTIAADRSSDLVKEVIGYARNVLEPEMKAVAPEAGFDFQDRSEFAGLDTAENAEITLLAKQLSGRNSHSKVAYGTEGGLFSQAGIPTVVCGPGNIDQAHKADEFIKITELEKCGAFLDRLIALCAR
ncbi:MAG: acetylornithine deacetylase [Hyphomicrobiales bacterium]|jgi:acetylornithine deacetylase|nr:acetylornithine deacetylase [Hyphomicrobiales bacterium]